jgi:regulator of sigma E protease
MSIGWTIGAFILVLTPIILVHELGHFVAARLSGIRVDEFGLGFPPRAVKLFKRGGTLYSLNWIPIGGFVRPAGEDDPSVPGGLAGASKKARLFTLIAGAGANFIFAALLLWIAFMIGPRRYDRYEIVITGVNENSPALEAGLLVSDVILGVNDVQLREGFELENAVGGMDTLKSEISTSAGTPVAMTVRRGGEELTLFVTPRLPGEFNAEVEGETGIQIAATGIGDGTGIGPIEASTMAIGEIRDVVWLTVQAPVMVIRGQIEPRFARPLSVVGISQLAGQVAAQSAEQNDIFPLLRFTALISIALGLTNLLPIPALDGGRILFVLVEAVRGRRIEPEREGMVHLVGMLFLLGLMVLIIIQDIINPIIPFQ